MRTAHAARVRLGMAALLVAGGIAICALASSSSTPARAAQKEEPGVKKDPLRPTGPDDVVTGFAACRACHNEKHPVDVKDNPFAKKYKSHEFVLLSEGRTWNREDPHSAAHRVLEGPLGKQMSGILKYDVAKAPQCLTCHAIDKDPGAPLPTKQPEIEARFETSEGVTCNACHGLRKPWQLEHYSEKNKTIPWRVLTPAKKEEYGMRNLRDPVVRSQLCASCHVGSPAEGKVVTHDMYAAGHPPLPPFEMATFMEGQPKHWGYPVNPELKFFTPDGFVAHAGADFVEDHPNWTWDLYRFHPQDQEVYLARQLVAGAVASLHAEMRMIAADADLVTKGQEGAVDFARFDCFACHHDLKYPSDRQSRGYAGPPGRPPLKAWTAALPGVVIEHAATLPKFAETTKGFKEKWDAVQAAALARPFGKPKELAAAANDMAAWCEEFMRKQQTESAPVYTPAEAAKLLALIGDAAVSKQWTADPEAAMHLTWAYVTLRDHMNNKIPADKLAALEKVIPTTVRKPPYETDDGPKTVGDTFRLRMDLFRKYDAKDFTPAFRDVLGKPK